MSRRKKWVSGSVQTGPARLSMSEPDEHGCIDYLVDAPVEPHWGAMPKSKNRMYVLQRGRRCGESAETLRAEVSKMYDVGGQGHFLHYEGPRSSYPYK